MRQASNLPIQAVHLIYPVDAAILRQAFEQPPRKAPILLPQNGRHRSLNSDIYDNLLPI
jgi:hypothetical protein